MRTHLLCLLALTGAAFAQTPVRPQNQPPRNPQQPRSITPAPRPFQQPGGPMLQPPGGPVQQQGAPAMINQDLSGLRTYLNLSEAQALQIQQAGERPRREAEEKARTNEPQIREKHMALEDLLAKGTNDAAAVGRLMIDIRALEKQVRDAREAVRSSQLNVLTPEQRARFRSIEEEASRPEAIREARRLGMVTLPAGQPGAGMQQPQPQMQPQMQPGMAPRPNQPRPMGQRQVPFEQR
jgi:Spy/CpxP family protein refolding chaperone